MPRERMRTRVAGVGVAAGAAGAAGAAAKRVEANGHVTLLENAFPQRGRFLEILVTAGPSAAMSDALDETMASGGEEAAAGDAPPVFLSPIATPLASAKMHKKLYKLVKKGASRVRVRGGGVWWLGRRAGGCCVCGCGHAYAVACACTLGEGEGEGGGGVLLWRLCCVMRRGARGGGLGVIPSLRDVTCGS